MVDHSGLLYDPSSSLVSNRGFSVFKAEFNPQLVPAGHVVEHRVASFGGPSLVEDVEGLQGFELLLLVDLMPAEESGNSLHLSDRQRANVSREAPPPGHELLELGAGQVEAGPVGVGHGLVFWRPQVGQQRGHLVEGSPAYGLVISATTNKPV